MPAIFSHNRATLKSWPVNDAGKNPKSRLYHRQYILSLCVRVDGSIAILIDASTYARCSKKGDESRTFLTLDNQLVTAFPRNSLIIACAAVIYATAALHSVTRHNPAAPGGVVN